MNEIAADLRRILQQSHTIAVVGLSPDPARPSHDVARYLQAQGYTIVPVNPACGEILGEKCYPSLRDVPLAIDIVDVFRRTSEVMHVAEDAIAIGARCLWLQLGVIAPEAATRAQVAGLEVVMDHCIKIEHRRLLMA